MSKKNKKTTRRETVGKVSRDLIIEAPKLDHSPHEQMSESLTEYEDNVHDAVEAGKKIYNNDFYVVVLTKKERIMKNVLRNYFMSRETCPTPDWDQAVYHYHKETEALEFLWVLPSKDVCKMLRLNSLTIDKSERKLLDYVMALDDGSLLRVAKRLNGEMDDSTLLA